LKSAKSLARRRRPGTQARLDRDHIKGSPAASLLSDAAEGSAGPRAIAESRYFPGKMHFM
jgi:hypothetical protein